MHSGRSRSYRTEEEEEVANAEYDPEENDDQSEDEEPGENDGMVDQFEAALATRKASIWLNGGAQKDVAIRVLIQCFGSMIESQAKPDAIPDFRGRIRPEDMEHRKLLDASKHVVKARQVLIKYENFDSRDFTIFIAQKKWVKNILRPLIELCAREDSALAMNCCSLALILIKKMSDRTLKLIDKFNKKKKKKAIQNSAIEEGGEEKEGEEKGDNNNNTSKEKSGKGAVTLHDSQSEDEASPTRIHNAKDQVLALLSFKEALCSELCNQAITNAFRECWVREQQATNEETKLGVARCISYFRRILSISPHKDWSTPSEILEQRIIHNRYIAQLRIFLSLLPGIISDVRRSYHDDWLTDIVLILFYIFDNFKPQELYMVWKSDALMKNFLLLAEETEDLAAAASSDAPANDAAVKSLSQPVVAPEALKKRLVSQTLGIGQGMGSLSSKLQGERINLQKQVASVGATRFARFTSTYQVPMYNAASLQNLSSAVQPSHQAVKKPGANTANTNNLVTVTAGGNKPLSTTPAVTHEEVESTGHLQVIPSSSILLKDPFAVGKSDVLPQAREKRNKKNLTFGQENDFLESSKQQAKLTEDGQRACVVVASLAESLTADVCFKNFVRRINEDLRRDELRVSPDMEWQYFSIVTKLLAYNRLKVEEEYRRVLQRRQEIAMDSLQEEKEAKDASSSVYWEPNLINVIDSMDKMSFTRVTFAMESLLRKPETYYLVVFPMQMYTEMICYLRIMLESSNEGHHEIAIGALYRLFYTSTGQMDPLFKLLSAWKPGAFPKAHLFQLVELIHQTLKTLEAAKNIFVTQGIYSEDMWKQKRKQLKKSGKKEMDMEMYLLSCLRFNVDDYFKRLVSNHTVSMYMRLLQRVDQNDAVVNHRVYVFLQRMCSFHLENNNNSNNFSSLGKNEHLKRSSSQDESTTHLGYLLFNVSCLQTIHGVLSDERLQTIDHLQPLIRLLRQVVRMFGTLANQNHLLFVEALFLHPHAHDHCLQLHSVYEAGSEAQRILQHQQDTSFLALSESDDANDSSDSDDNDDNVNQEHSEEREMKRLRRQREKEEKRRLREMKRSVQLGQTDKSHRDDTDAQNKRDTRLMALSDTDESETGDKLPDKKRTNDEEEDDEEEFNDEIMEARRLESLNHRRSKGKRSQKATTTKTNVATGEKKKRLLKKNNRSKDEDTDEELAGDIWNKYPTSDEDDASSNISDSDSDDNDGDDTKKTKTTTKSKTKKSKLKNTKKSGKDDDNEDNDDNDNDASSIDSADTATKAKRLLQRESRATRKTWTAAEDKVLKRLYRQYKGMATMYVAISMSDELKALGSERNEQQIKHRVKYLRLEELADDDFAEDETGDNDQQQKQSDTKTKRSKRDVAGVLDSPSATLATTEGVTSVEKDDEDEIVPSKKNKKTQDTRHQQEEEEEDDDTPAAWDTMRHSKRPFDEYDFSEEPTKTTNNNSKNKKQKTNTTSNTTVSRKKIVKRNRLSEDNDDDNDRDTADMWGEQTDTAPQAHDSQQYETQDMDRDTHNKKKRGLGVSLEDDDGDRDLDDTNSDTFSDDPSNKRFKSSSSTSTSTSAAVAGVSAVDLARGGFVGHSIQQDTADRDTPTVRTINLKRTSLKHLLDSDDEDFDMMLKPPPPPPRSTSQ